ncbi:hypothetical protein D9M72_640170 [compost metagenome]
MRRTYQASRLDQDNTPIALARTTAWVRRVTPSLWLMCLVCALTVLVEMYRRSPISWLESPSASSSSTANSREVSSSRFLRLLPEPPSG